VFLRRTSPNLKCNHGTSITFALKFVLTIFSGLVYRMRKPIYWSPSSGTALAEAELEYDENHKSTAAFVRFPITSVSAKLQSLPGIDPENLGAVIWTTTPWTLPANQAIAVHNNLEYSVVTLSGNPKEQLLVGKSRLDYLQSFFGSQELKVVIDTIAGSDIAGGLKYSNPIRIDSHSQPVIHADFVSSASGSGLVHCAPGHGMDDYIVCTALGLEALAPVCDQGKFTVEAAPKNPDILQGKSVQSEGTTAVLEYLHTLAKAPESCTGNLVLATHQITHKYPIDWRTKLPVIIRATEQWFADVGSLKGDALKSLEKVKFIPDAGKHRLESFVQGRSQWCISRQRAWGVPIPALYRTDRDALEAVMTGSTIDHIMKVIQERGIDAWWTDPEDDPAWAPPSLQGKYIRGKDTMDVWFDSGTSWTLLPERSAQEHVADVYLEGSDQHRGWFQSSLLTHIAHQQASTSTARLPPKAPFKTLITHGFVLDQNNRKMSKSLGNVIAPSQITDGSLLPPVQRKKQKGATNSSQPHFDAMGPDALRLWVASCDYTSDVTIGQPVLQGIHQSLHKYRVTFKWLVGALADYNPQAEIEVSTPYAHELVDRIALHQLQVASHNVHTSFSNSEFFKAVHTLNRYVSNDLSAFYFETLKDRLYTGSREERVSAQAVLYHIFNNLLTMLGPMTPLLVEEVWDFTPDQVKEATLHPLKRVWSPFLASSNTGSAIDEQISLLMCAQSAVKSALEDFRTRGKMGSSLECDVYLHLPASVGQVAQQLFSPSMEAALANIFVVSKVFVSGANSGKTPDTTALEADGGISHSFYLTSNDRVQEDQEQCRVLVTKPSGDKCGRCWRYLELTSYGLCQRCEGAVKEEHSDLSEV
jgi:isoleucyl-tRNA synthetase